MGLRHGVLSDRSVAGQRGLIVFRHLLALRCKRHLSLYGMVWLHYMPGYIQQTRLGEVMGKVWRRRRVTLALCLVLMAAGQSGSIRHQAWALPVPVTSSDPGPQLLYPAGATDYLRQIDFHGNVMTPFNQGSFVIWSLYPKVKVSLDSRFEVAYPLEAVAEAHDFHGGQPGWHAVLTKYPTDLVLVPLRSKLQPLMVQAAGWTAVYRDDAFGLYARSGLTLPVEDHRGQPIVGRFP